MQPRGDHRLEILEEVALVILGDPEDRHAADMHRHLRRFQIQKRRVHRGQFFAFSHGFLPADDYAMRLKRFLEAFFKDQGGPVQATCPDCACSGVPYAMANGPDRSNGQNSPSACASRSATAHNGAALTPRPMWLARRTSIFSAVSEGRSSEVRQFTMPSLRL